MNYENLSYLWRFKGRKQYKQTGKKIAESSGCDYETIELGKLEVKPCTGCSECMMNEGKCPIEDDMQDLYEN